MKSTTFHTELELYGPEADAPPEFTPGEARRYCRRLAQRHYENFTVGGLVVPRRARAHVANVYAYCRWADDLADETGGPGERLGTYPKTTEYASHGRKPPASATVFGSALRAANKTTGCTTPGAVGNQSVLLGRLRLLDWWEGLLDDCYAGRARHPVFVALRETIKRFNIPRSLFADLLIAFRQDQAVTRYERFEDLLGYCRNSANPVGRIVLCLAGCHEPDRVALSDSVCTGLQLANFWQDVARDWEMGRLYLPLEDCRRFEVAETVLDTGECSDAFRKLLAYETQRAERYLQEGLPLVAMMPKPWRLSIALFVRGGLEILKTIRRQNYDVLTCRPTVPKGAKLRLVAGCWWQLRWGRFGKTLSMSYPPEILGTSYEQCRRVARRAHSNFTPCFRLLSRERRRAMETLYAFMRHTDDLVDGEASKTEATQALAGWREATRAALSGSLPETSDEPGILPAVADTVDRFGIAQACFLDAIDGAEMDLSRQRYETFEELSQYCYRVASVVGLACLRIWGYRGEDPSPAAHACGLAFQLTNILRDVREDYERGRVYLPQEDLHRFGVSETEFAQTDAGKPFRELMKFEVERAGRYYHEAAALAEGLEGEGRRIFLMMIRVYYRLLKRIELEPNRVLSQHVRLGRWHAATITIRTLLRPSARAVLP